MGHENSPAERRGAGESLGCRVRFGPRLIYQCGRKLHEVVEGIDVTPVCLMHSNDPKKNSGSLHGNFWVEVETILQAADDDDAHFGSFVFPRGDLSGREFKVSCNFMNAVFAEDIDFSKVHFQRGADFGGAKFLGKAKFYRAQFSQDVEFSGVFSGDANFNGASFGDSLTFMDSTFKGDADFAYATFAALTSFSRSVFQNDAEFSGATFAGETYFNHVVFERDALFDFSTLQLTNFEAAQFHGTTSWRSCQFLDQTLFRGTIFEPTIDGEPSAVFALARFSKPNEVVFDNVDLSRALFSDSDITQLLFTSSVRWGSRDSKHHPVVFEEVISLDHELASRLQSSATRDYGAIARIYQQLKKNYDSALDFWTADQFHFSEMEMKLNAATPNRKFPRSRQWLRRRFGLIALYKYASDYGNSYWKPSVWLFATLIAFAGLFPLPRIGLKPQNGKQVETYRSAWQISGGFKPKLWKETRLVAKSAITSVDVATFQKGAEYCPVYPWGRVLSIIETLLTSTLFALFLLAIRRKFKR